jgi:hypothetical protein
MRKKKENRTNNENTPRREETSYCKDTVQQLLNLCRCVSFEPEHVIPVGVLFGGKTTGHAFAQ